MNERINGSPEFDDSAPTQAHSKTEYKRLVAQGANVLPPTPRFALLPHNEKQGENGNGI